MKVRFEPLYTLHLLLRSGRRYSASALCERLSCSRATLKRLIAHMRNRMGAPIRCSHGDHLYHYDPHHGTFELPGLWFGPTELVALATLIELLRNLEPGLLREHLEACRKRIRKLVADDLDIDLVGERIRLLSMQRRPVATAVFTCVCNALVHERRLRFDYPEHGTGPLQRRTVSPQRLVRYRDNWYLDCWCHRSNGLRSFALAWITNVQISEEPRRRVSERRLKRFFATTYGIYNGPSRAIAVIRFTGPAARYAAVEQWHPRQKRTLLPDGSVELRFPYGIPTELVKDILSWGEFAEVVEPPELRELIANKLKNMMIRYAEPRDHRVT